MLTGAECPCPVGGLYKKRAAATVKRRGRVKTNYYMEQPFGASFTFSAVDITV